jgi:hypothetical protein
LLHKKARQLAVAGNTSREWCFIEEPTPCYCATGRESLRERNHCLIAMRAFDDRGSGIVPVSGSGSFD